MEGYEGVLPKFLREALGMETRTVEELRLREGQPLSASVAGKEWTHPAWKGRLLRSEDLQRVLEMAGRGSVHTILDQIREGYVTAPGGFRIGVCGEGAVQEGKLLSFRHVTSLAIRFPRKLPGVARPVIPKLLREGQLESTLILSPPGWGKTTLLRDLIRCLSSGEGCPPRRVGVADQRGELGAGHLRHDLGPRTDVMENLPKAQGMMMLLRAMSPQVLAADEITAPEDIRAMEQAAGCGVSLLATAHGRDRTDLDRRPLYRELLAMGIFRKLVVIGLEGERRTYQVVSL
ncbi:MAG: stage III sporulation protein AB [Ruminiclostridium sp.]|nr:stage III sporulation protein AB [Ruminiclostridium sp.]